MVFVKEMLFSEDKSEIITRELLEEIVLLEKFEFIMVKADDFIRKIDLFVSSNKKLENSQSYEKKKKNLEIF